MSAITNLQPASTNSAANKAAANKAAANKAAANKAAANKAAANKAAANKAAANKAAANKAPANKAAGTGFNYTFNGFFGLFNTKNNASKKGGYKKNKKNYLTRKYKSN
jgi:membrane protein involved in colicin uptake